eukprot:gene40212-48998_t
MPKEFKYSIANQIHFSCKLHSTQCGAQAKSGERCRRRCIIGFEYCHSHLQSKLMLKIKDSTLPGAGKGLFAYRRNKGDDEVVFRAGNTICTYNGQLINAEELADRYGDHNAPYAIRLSKREAIDAACKRGVGALGNTNRGMNNATLSISTQNKTASVKATKTIRNGNEIFISYGRGSPSVHPKPALKKRLSSTLDNGIVPRATTIAESAMASFLPTRELTAAAEGLISR